MRVERVRPAPEPEPTGFRLSWGGVFAGLVVAVVAQMLLSLLGLAIGLAAVDPQVGAGDVGMAAGIWTAISALISLFIGGVVAGHLAGVLTRLDGLLHGVLVWGLSAIVALWAVAAGAGVLLGGAFGLVGDVAAGAAEVGAAAATQLDGVPTGGDREQIVQILREQGVPEQQAQEAATRIQGTVAGIQEEARQLGATAPQAATQVAGTLSTAAWWTLLAAILSLAAAAGGAALTARE